MLAVTLMALAAAPAWAGSVTVVNGGTETIRSIVIGGGDNRLRSTLPPGASARIAYSSGCQATVRLGFESGRNEEFAGVDPCTDPQVVTGQGVVSAGTPGQTTAPVSRAAATPGLVVAKGPALPAKAPPPVVPPWSGRSITKRFGGLD